MSQSETFLGVYKYPMRWGELPGSKQKAYFQQVKSSPQKVPESGRSHLLSLAALMPVGLERDSILSESAWVKSGGSSCKWGLLQFSATRPWAMYGYLEGSTLVCVSGWHSTTFHVSSEELGTAPSKGWGPFHFQPQEASVFPGSQRGLGK